MKTGYRRSLLVFALIAAGTWILGAGYSSRHPGVVGQIDLLLEAVETLTEVSGEHDEDIQLIVSHIRDLKASLCDLHGAEALPGICESTCVPGICDTVPDDPCVTHPEMCDDDGGR